MQLLLVGVNYKQATLADRETLAFDGHTRQEILNTLIGKAGIEELVLISTCNRTEFYAIAPEPQAAREVIVDYLSIQTGWSRRDWEEHAYTFYNKFAAMHLFEVAAGLDSMVLGENEILGQVKQALEEARHAGVCGQILNQLMRFAITAGKRVRAETRINEGCTSIAALASRRLQQSLDSHSKVLILGAGQIAEVLLQHLSPLDLELTIVNRSQAKAIELADKFHTQYCPVDELSLCLENTDAVVTCTSAPDYLIEELTPRSAEKPLLMIDLSVPRNIDPQLAQHEQVSLYDVDHLQEQVQSTLEQRSQSVAKAQTILAEEATRFLEWFNNRDVVPTIRSLYSMFEEIRQREVSRGTQKYKDSLNDEANQVIERVTKAVIQKILHYPVVQLKAAAPADQMRYEEALSELFGLAAADGIDRYVHLPQSTARHSVAHP